MLELEEFDSFLKALVTRLGSKP